jgi:hypothetical protein
MNTPVSTKFYQPIGISPRYDFDFTNSFLSGDTVASATITVTATGPTTAYVISGQVVQVSFSSAGLTAGTVYELEVKATSTAGRSDILKCVIQII